MRKSEHLTLRASSVRSLSKFSPERLVHSVQLAENLIKVMNIYAFVMTFCLLGSC